MSGDYTGTCGAAEREKISSAASKKIEKGLKRLLIVAGVILGAEAVWLFVISPCIPLSTLEIRGFPGFEGAKVLEYAGIGEGASFVSVDAKAAERLLAEHYLVDSVRVVKRFPDRLSIYLEPRQAVALSLAKLEGRLLPLYYDRHGVVFMAGSGAGEKMTSNIPVISGLNFENPVLGMRLPDSLKPLLENLEKINRSAPELLAAVSEIEIRAKPFDGFDLVLYPLHSPIRVRLENTMNEDTLRYVMLLLDVFKSRSSIPEEIDFRSGMGSYKVKEAPSGE